MVYECHYNDVTDVQPTVESLSIDITEAIETGVVMASGTEWSDNGIDSDCNAIIGRVRDAFEVVDAQRAIASRAQKAVAAPGAAPASSSGVNPDKGA